MAALIRSLAVSGSRKASGVVNASGKVFLYSPGTTTVVAGYQDDELSEAHTTSAGGIELDAAGKVEIWVNDPVDVVIEDSEGTTVSTMLGFNKTRAEQVEVENDLYTGAYTDPTTGAVTQALGGKIDLDTILTRFGTSLGPNGQYQPTTGATPRDYSEVIADIWISVVDFGADPTGNADSTTAIQTAMNLAKANGGGVVYFPPGTYKISVALSLESADGVSILGTGASVISQTGGTANGLRFVGCDGLRIQGVEVSHATSSSGTAFSLDTCTDVTLITSSCGNLSVGGNYLVGLNALDCTRLVSIGCTYASTGASNMGINLEGTTRFAFFGGEVGSTLGTGLTLNGAGSGSFHGMLLDTIAVAAAGVSGFIDFFGCGEPSLTVASATIPAIRMFGGGAQASQTSSAVGAAQTPSLIAGSEVVLTAASGGAGAVTVNAPAVLPGTDINVDVNRYWDFVFKNASGGAVTWTMNAVYVLDGAVAIPTTDGHTIHVRFRWDETTSKLRETSRSDTVT